MEYVDMFKCFLHDMESEIGIKMDNGEYQFKSVRVAGNYITPLKELIEIRFALQQAQCIQAFPLNIVYGSVGEEVIMVMPDKTHVLNAYVAVGDTTYELQATRIYGSEWITSQQYKDITIGAANKEMFDLSTYKTPVTLHRMKVIHKAEKKNPIEVASAEVLYTTTSLIGPAVVRAVSPIHTVSKDEVAKLTGGNKCDKVIAHAELNKQASLSFDHHMCIVMLGGVPINLPDRETAEETVDDIEAVYQLLTIEPPKHLRKSYLYWKALQLDTKYRGQSSTQLGDVVNYTPARRTLAEGKQLYRGMSCTFVNVCMDITEMAVKVINNGYFTSIVIQCVFKLLHNDSIICVGSTTDFPDMVVRLQNHFMFKRLNVSHVKWQGKVRNYAHWWRKFFKVYRLLGDIHHVCDNAAQHVNSRPLCTECMCNAESIEGSLWTIHKAYDLIEVALSAVCYKGEDYSPYLYAFPTYKGKIKCYTSSEISSSMFPEISSELRKRTLPWLERGAHNVIQNFQITDDESLTDPLSYNC